MDMESEKMKVDVFINQVKQTTYWWFDELGKLHYEKAKTEDAEYEVLPQPQLPPSNEIK